MPMKRSLPSSRSRTSSSSVPPCSISSPRRRHVYLDEVEPIGLQPPQALLDIGADVGGAVVVGVGRGGVRRQRQRAAALGGQKVLVAAAADEAADQLLAAPVVDRRVDQIDARVEQLVEEPAGVSVIDRRPAWLAPQLHGAVAEDGHLCPGPPELSRGDRHGRDLIPRPLSAPSGSDEQREHRSERGVGLDAGDLDPGGGVVPIAVRHA